MKKLQFIEYLEKFDIEKDNIKEILTNKKIIENNENIFLSNKDLKKTQVLTNNIIFIKLIKLLPTTFLLNLIFEHTSNIIELNSRKAAVNFTFSKNLVFENIPKTSRMMQNKYYIITYQKKPIGIATLNKKVKKFPIENIMNIGEYLKEN